MMHNLMLVRRPPNRHPVMTIPSSTTWAPPAKQRDLMVPGAVTPLPERPGLRWTPMVLQGSAEKVDQDGIATQIVQGTGPAPGHDNTQLDGGVSSGKGGLSCEEFQNLLGRAVAGTVSNGEIVEQYGGAFLEMVHTYRAMRDSLVSNAKPSTPDGAESCLRPWKVANECKVRVLPSARKGRSVRTYAWLQARPPGQLTFLL